MKSRFDVKKILLQTTIPYTKDDWSIARFSMLAEILSAMKDGSGKRFQVTARDRENLPNGDDRVLAKLDTGDFDQLWLFGVDVGNGLTSGDCEAITRFHQRGGGIVTTRDHQDLGISFCTLGGIGAANHFHSKNQEPDPKRQKIDDTESPNITWPNYHSGSNGDFQRVQTTEPLHPVMRNPKNPSGKIETLPAHPHEGAISVPSAESKRARVIVTGKSTLTANPFNIAIAFEANGKGKALVDSSFHHFLDYNLDPAKGCPSFVTEPPGHSILENPQAAEDARAYARNIALWLAS
jgi:hypothetical protein